MKAVAAEHVLLRNARGRRTIARDPGHKGFPGLGEQYVSQNVRPVGQRKGEVLRFIFRLLAGQLHDAVREAEAHGKPHAAACVLSLVGEKLQGGLVTVKPGFRNVPATVKFWRWLDEFPRYVPVILFELRRIVGNLLPAYDLEQ